MGRVGTSLSVLAALASTLVPSVAAAQTGDNFRRDRNEGVRDRSKPEYTAPGVPAGGFRLFPEAAAVGYWSDNIFATDAGAESDFVTELQGAARLSSIWSAHALNFSASADTSFYSEFDDENTTDWSIGADGRLDVTRDFFFTGALTRSALHEQRADSPTITPLEEPIQYAATQARIGAIKRFNRLQWSGQASYGVYDYEDGDLPGGGVFEQDDRDRTITELGTRLDYAVSPDTALFVSLAGNWRDYDLDPPAPGASVLRDSSGVEALIGANFDLTRLTRGEVSIGYLEQDYDDPSLAATSGLATRTQVEWFVDPLVTVTFRATREVRDAGVFNAGGYLTEGLGVEVDYELRRNVILGAGFGLSRDDYEGVDREDERFRAQARLDYVLNRNVSLAFEASRFEQSSSGADFGREYEINRALVSLRLRR